MGREVRMVPANWQHPKYPADHHLRTVAGRYVPLLSGSYAEHAAEWDEGFSQWRMGFVRSYDDEKWVPREDRHGCCFTEWEGQRPSPDDYMPEWPENQRTHFMMYENTTEGTPISPVFSTPEDLARWLVDNQASAFGSMTATYEEWLVVARGSWAPSAIIEDGVLNSGVSAFSGTAS